MRQARWRWVWLGLLAIGANAAGYTQVAEAPTVRFPEGGTREYVDSLYVPSVPNVPFTATLLIETTQVMEDGGTMTRHTYNHIGRDGQGRVRLERREFLPASATTEEPKLLSFTLVDADGRAKRDCFPAVRLCRVITVRYDLLATPPPAGPLGDKRSLERVRLGNAQKSGFDTTGVRETITAEPQAVGNDRVMVSQKEIWYSPQLHMNLSVVRQSPKSGTTVLTVGSIDRAEPEAAFMAVPEGYRVVDERVSPGLVARPPVR